MVVNASDFVEYIEHVDAIDDRSLHHVVAENCSQRKYRGTFRCGSVLPPEVLIFVRYCRERRRGRASSVDAGHASIYVFEARAVPNKGQKLVQGPGSKSPAYAALPAIGRLLKDARTGDQFCAILLTLVSYPPARRESRGESECSISRLLTGEVGE